MYNFFETEMDLDAQRKKIVFAERKRVLNENGKTYQWDKVKKMAKNKKLRNVL